MIKVLREIPWDDLEGMIRKVPLLKKRDAQGGEIFPYKDARIELREVDPNELNPTSFYVLEKNLAFQRQLCDDLAPNYDPAKLECGLEIKNEKGEIWRRLPPIVEVMRERVIHANVRGDIAYDKATHVNVAIINDGLHTTYVAREKGKRIVVVHISGISEDEPFYALPNGWDEIKVFTDVPKTMAEKKFYRCKESYNLYRNFEVLGCGKPRHTGTGTKT